MIKINYFSIVDVSDFDDFFENILINNAPIPNMNIIILTTNSTVIFIIPNIFINNQRIIAVKITKRIDFPFDNGFLVNIQTIANTANAKDRLYNSI